MNFAQEIAIFLADFCTLLYKCSVCVSTCMIEVPALYFLRLLLTEPEYGYIADFPEGQTDRQTDSAVHRGLSEVCAHKYTPHMIMNESK